MPTIFFALSVLVFVLLSLFVWAGYRMSPESSPVARGAAYARVRGCVSCHGDPQNPLPDRNNKDCSEAKESTSHPTYTVACVDVMAYFETVRLRRNMDDRAKYSANSLLITGEKLARRYHCFQCHGHLGQGGFKNSNSFKGYVPGYFGSDFKVLTRNANRDSVREWITQGIDSAIVEKPIIGWIAAFFFRRQTINMPSYKSLKSKEIEILVDYVITLNKFGPLTTQRVRAYGERTRTAEEFATSR